MDEQELKQRTKQLALKIIALVGELPREAAPQVMGRQLLRSGTSVGANYRAACCSKSTSDMILKLSIVEEEADETLYWLELLTESGLVPEERANELMHKTREILAITIASKKTLRSRLTTQTKK